MIKDLWLKLYNLTFWRWIICSVAFVVLTVAFILVARIIPDQFFKDAEDFALSIFQHHG